MSERKEVLMGVVEELTGVRNGGSGQVVKDQLLVTRNLEAVPEAAKAKSLQEAVKIIKRSENRSKYELLASEVAEVAIGSRHDLRHAEAQNVMSEDGQYGKYDVILCDPPYGMGADTFGDSQGSTGAHGYSDSYESWLALMGDLIPLTIRVTKPQAHLYMFCDFDRFHELSDALSHAGWKVFRTPLIMHKLGQTGRVPWPKNGPRRQYELVLFAQRGDKLVNNIYHDVFEAPLIPDRMGHPAEKPVAALKNLLQRSANAGDHVLDMCCGSGPIFEAGHELGLYVTGIERDATFYGMSKARLAGLK